MLSLTTFALRDLGQIVTGRTPPTNRPDFLGGGPAFITPTDISDESIYANPKRRLSPSGEIEFRRIILPPDTVCFTCIASIGKMCLTKERSLTNQQINSLIVDRARFEPRWVFYALKTMREQIAAFASGAATPIINKTSYGNVKLSAPNLQVQRRIASILGAYDNLIEVNRRRVAVLEEMAGGLFEEWFVRFRFPGYDDVATVETPDRPMPEGWQSRTIGQLGQVITGKTPSKTQPEYFGHDIPFVKIPDLHDTIFATVTTQELSNEGAASQSNKTVPPGALCVSCIGTIGLVAITTGFCQTNQQINTVVPLAPEWTEYLYFSLVRLKAHLINLGSNGATMGNVNKHKFSGIEVICPTSDLLAAFHRYALPIFKLIRNSEQANRCLAASRDLLIPRLISGQLSVEAAESQLEEAA